MGSHSRLSKLVIDDTMKLVVSVDSNSAAGRRSGCVGADMMLISISAPITSLTTRLNSS